jgi:hypothetical protein
MDFLQGTLEMMILSTLVFGKRHGDGIAVHPSDFSRSAAD